MPATRFRHSFSNHDTHTVQWAGFKGKKNGELLRSAELAGYDVLLTVDQGIPQQQSPTHGKLAIILIQTIQPRQTIAIPPST